MGRLKPLEVLAVDWTEWGVGMGVVTNRLREVLEKGVTYPGDWTDLEIAQGIEYLEGVQKKREKERNQRYRVTYTGTLSVDNLRRSITLDSLQDYMGNAVRLPMCGFGLPTEKSGMKSVSFGLNGGQVDIVRVED